MIDLQTKYSLEEKWNLTHPFDELPKYLGIDGQYIPERYIPYDVSLLVDGDTLIGETGEVLQYYKEDKSFHLVTNKAYMFLSTPFQKWYKNGK